MLQHRQHRVQQEQENNKRATDRGLAAGMLLAAQRHRQDMEKALQEVEQNTLQERQQDLVAGKLHAAPLLQRWQRQKRQVQATRAFEQEFLPGVSSARQILPSFLEEVEVTAAGEEGGEGEGAGLHGARGDTEADRALRFVKQLKQQKQRREQQDQERQQQQRKHQQQQQRQEEQRGEEDQHQRQRQQQQKGKRQGGLVSGVGGAASTTSPMPVVEDLMTHIPPVPSSSTTDSAATAAASTTTSDLVAAAVAAVDAEHGSIRSSSSTTVSETLTEILQQAEAAVAGLAELRGQAGEHQLQQQQQPGITFDEATSSLEQATAAKAGGAERQHHDKEKYPDGEEYSHGLAEPEGVGRRYAASIASTSSMGSLGELLREAEAVLQQLPEDIQAAIAADDKAEMDQGLLLGSGRGAMTRQQQQQHGHQGIEGGAGAAGVDESATSVEAAAILDKLKQLQRELGVQVRSLC